jgi:hypothetical protein
MPSIKSRGNDAQISTGPEEKVDLARLANIGKKIELSFGEVTVKEPSLEEILVLVSDFAVLIELMRKDQNLIEALKTPEFFSVLKKVAAVVSNSDPTLFDNLPVSDWLSMIVAVKEVVDWEKMTELFTLLGLTEAVKAQIPQKL